ncbi:M10 family metallopeptidase C-terminal domain-containing protein [Falsiroseomonas sp.]|uniref:M10 family metallopeptidase C-terminal domain-containing protein n=1 Tax=Falsiroseomonas sp. TaxID=2870721 RepID=UPI003F6F3049
MTTVFINEIHYDNDGTDADERIEVVGPAGTDLTGWTLVRYNGSNGTAYASPAALNGLSGVLADQGGGFGTAVVSFPANGLQNGAPDGIALVDPDGVVVQFLSYEGTLTAVDGPAAGLTSTDIGVAQEGTDPLGSALQLTGTGTEYEDFTWAATPGSNTFGGLNAGQSFGGEATPGLVVSATDLALQEGGTAGSFTVVLRTQPTADVTVTLAAPGDDLSLSAQSLVFTAANWDQPQQVQVTALEDDVAEGAEALAIAITLTSTDAAYDGLAPVAVDVAVTDALAMTAIYTIQGSGLTSSLTGQQVRTSGIVTAVDSNGYYLQDATGDGDAATSDAIFVFTSGAPGVAVGDAVTVQGLVSEFTPGGVSSGNLSTTQITATGAGASLVTSSGNALPDAVVLGPNGLLPPTESLVEGVAFYESLEAMRVTLEAPKVVGATNGFGEIWTIVGEATGLSDRGTLNIEPGTGGPGVTNATGGDFNPERIQIDEDTGVFASGTPSVDVGAELGDVTGVISYNFGNYELIPTEAYTVTAPSTLEREVTSFRAEGADLLVATYNVLNLDPKLEDQNLVADRSASNVDDDVGNGQFAAIARDIVTNLKTPDIIALQEVQDGDGGEISDLVSAEATLQALVDAIVAAGGPRYEFVDNPFVENGGVGGQPGGNIRNAYLYNPDRVALVEGSLRTVEDAAFDGSRLPLIADFTFQGETVTLVNNHFSSKGGSQPLFGANQPAANGSEDERQAQAEAVRDFVDATLAADADANIVVLGDHNEFEFEEPMQELAGEGAPLVNLTDTLPPLERYSYNFDGNSQSLDHILVNAGLAGDTRFDAVHVNSEFAEQSSDHDPLLALIALGGITRTGGDGADRLLGRAGGDELAGGAGADRLLGRGGADLLLGGAGGDRLNGGTGGDTLSGEADNDTMVGGAGDDLLLGGTGDDRLFGQDGNDRLVGGQGADVLWGGEGADIFLFAAFTESPREAASRILDFASEEGDRISLEGFAQDFVFVGSNAFAGGGQASVRVHLGPNGTALQLDAGDGAGPEMVIRLAGQQALTEADFLL